MRRAAVAVVVLLTVGCGGADGPPRRGVVEHDVDGWSFRRYQRLLDVEVWVQGNPAVAHSVSYARGLAEKRGRLASGDVVNAVVTRYGKDLGIDRGLVQFARRLAQDRSYRVEERTVADVRLLWITGGGEAWAMWPARQHVVKVGGPGRVDVPDALIEAYGERYRSRLTAGALDAPLPPAPGAPPPAEPAFDPAEPRPTWRDR
jgi:hypothetical protein